MIYLLNIGSLFLYYFILKLVKLKDAYRNNIFLFIFFFQLFIIHGLKNPYCFPDTPEYAQGFREICEMDFSDYLLVGAIKAEIGYSFFMKLVSYVSNHEQAIFIATSLVIIGCYIKTIKNYSMMPWMSLFLFLIGGFNQSMYVLRQHLAMAILLVSLPYIIKRKFGKFLLLNGLACSIHLTAIVFFPIYFIYERTLSKKNIFLLILLGAILGCILNQLILLVSSNYQLYTAYIDSDAPGTNLKMFLFFFFFFCFCLMYMKIEYSVGGINKLLIMILIIGMIIQAIGTGNPITGRLNMYYSNFIFLLIPNMLSSISSKTTRYILSFILLLFLTCIYLVNLQSMETYKFFWEL